MPNLRGKTFVFHQLSIISFRLFVDVLSEVVEAAFYSQFVGRFYHE